MVTIMALLVRRSDLSRDEFRAYYDERHRSLFRTITPADVQAGIVRYVQHHALDRTDAQDESPWDCITEMGFADQAALRAWGRWYASEDGRPLREDELRFMDNSRRRIVLTEPR